MEIKRKLLSSVFCDGHYYPSYLATMALKSAMASRKFGQVKFGPADIATSHALKIHAAASMVDLEGMTIQDMGLLGGCRVDLQDQRAIVRIDLGSQEKLNLAVRDRYRTSKNDQLRLAIRNDSKPFENMAKTRFSIADRIMHRIVGDGLWIFFDLLGLNPFRDALPLRRVVEICLEMMDPKRPYSRRQIGYYTADVARLIGVYTKKIEVIRPSTGFSGRDPYHLVLMDIRWMHRIADRIAKEQSRFMAGIAMEIGQKFGGRVVQEFDGRSSLMRPGLRKKIEQQMERINHINRQQLTKGAKMKPDFLLRWGGLGNVPIYFIKIKYVNTVRDPQRRFNRSYWQKKRRDLGDLAKQIENLIRERALDLAKEMKTETIERVEQASMWKDFGREYGPKLIDIEPGDGDGLDDGSENNGCTLPNSELQNWRKWE